MSDFVDSFVKGCKERGLNDEQIKTAAARIVELHPEVRDEFEKAAILPLALLAGVAGAAAPWLIDKLTSDSKAPEAPAATAAPSSWNTEPVVKPKVTSGAPPQNLYAQPGMGGMAPRYWPSMAMPPGGFPAYGPSGHPGSPFGTSPFNHTVLPPFMPKAGSAMEKDAFLGALAMGAARLLPRLANSGIGTAVGKGLQGLGSLFSKGLPAGAAGPVAPNALQRAGSSVLQTGARRADQVAGQALAKEKGIKALMATGKYATPAEAAAHLQQAGSVRGAQNALNVHGNYANASQAASAAAPKPGFWANHGMSVGLTGAMMAPMFMGGGGEMPPPQMPQGGMEQQASWLPPTIGNDKRAAITPTKPGSGNVRPKMTPITESAIPADAVVEPETRVTPPSARTPPRSLMARVGSGALRTGLAGLGGLGIGMLGRHLLRPYAEQAGQGSIQAPPSPFDKAAIGPATIIGGIGGALNHPEDRGEGALRGAGIGFGTDVGMMGGANAGGHLALNALRSAPPGAQMVGAALGALGGGAAGGYGGYRLGKRMFGKKKEEHKKAANASGGSRFSGLKRTAVGTAALGTGMLAAHGAARMLKPRKPEAEKAASNPFA